MADMILLGRVQARFLMEHLVSERNLARNLPNAVTAIRCGCFCRKSLAQAIRKDIDHLAVLDLSAEQVRRCS